MEQIAGFGPSAGALTVLASLRSQAEDLMTQALCNDDKAGADAYYRMILLIDQQEELL